MTPGWMLLAVSVELCAAVAIIKGFPTGSGFED
jgi:hypothetical protein